MVRNALVLAAVGCWTTTAVMGATMDLERPTADVPADDDAGNRMLGAVAVLAVSFILLVAVMQSAVDGGGESEVDERSELAGSDLEVGGRTATYHAALAPAEIVCKFVARGSARENGHFAPKPLGCFGTVGRLLDSRAGRCLGLFGMLGLFYSDIWTDVLVVFELLDQDSPHYDVTASPNAACALISIIALLPVFQSLVDAFDRNSMDWWKALPLNCTYTRMIYFVWKGSSKNGGKRISKETADAKLFEAILESMPQLFVQAGVVAAGLVAFDGTVQVSLTLSVVSIAHAATLKVHALYDMDKRPDGGVFAAVLAFVYFGVDSTSRALAVYLTIARHGMGITPFAPFIGVWIGLEVVYRGLIAGLCKYEHHRSRSYTDDGDCRFKSTLQQTGAVTSWDDVDRAKLIEYRRNIVLNYRKLAWAVDPSLVSGALALFSALPLSTNPTERRWLFATSTVAVMAASWEAGFDVGGTGAAVALAICVSVKVLLFIGMDLACPNSTFHSELSEHKYGLGAFSIDVEKQQMAWLKKGEFLRARGQHRSRRQAGLTLSVFVLPCTCATLTNALFYCNLPDTQIGRDILMNRRPWDGWDRRLRWSRILT